MSDAPANPQPVNTQSANPEITVQPLTLENFDGFVAMQMRVGARSFKSCSCMYFRNPETDYSTGSAEQNRADLRVILASGAVPGLVAIRSGKVVGWVGVGPRGDFPRLENSAALKAIDDVDAWPIICFFVDRSHRRQGVATALLKAAAAHAKSLGAVALEAFPVDSAAALADDHAFHGPLELFERDGYLEVARQKANRPILRKLLD